MPPPFRIPLGRPWMDDAEIGAVARVVRSGWVMQGPEVAALEGEFAAFVGAPHACAVSSGTAALHLALRAVGVAPDDDVLTVSHSFIATANAVRFCGARPVFVDVEPLTFNLDPDRLQAAVTPRTRALLVAHQVGMPADLARLLPLARRLGLPLVEDAACAIGSEIRVQGRWERIGRPHADVACFSFHPRKLLSTGEGGMVTTARADVDASVRRARQHGKGPSDARFVETGWNYRLTDVQAAIGREQLRRVPEMVIARRAAAARYADLLAADARFTAPAEPAWARSNWQSYAVTVADGLDVAALVERVRGAGIEVQRGVACAHREPAYAGLPHGDLSQSERASDRTLLLPLFHGIAAAEQAEVVQALSAAAR